MTPEQIRIQFRISNGDEISAMAEENDARQLGLFGGLNEGNTIVEKDGIIVLFLEIWKNTGIYIKPLVCLC